MLHGMARHPSEVAPTTVFGIRAVQPSPTGLTLLVPAGAEPSFAGSLTAAQGVPAARHAVDAIVIQRRTGRRLSVTTHGIAGEVCLTCSWKPLQEALTPGLDQDMTSVIALGPTAGAAPTDAHRSTLSALLRRLNLFTQEDHLHWLLTWNIHLSQGKSAPSTLPPADLAALLADPTFGVPEPALSTLQISPPTRRRSAAAGTAVANAVTTTQSIRSYYPADDLPIGRRIAYWRVRRKMSQQVFADRMGKSATWVDKVERGIRRIDKFSVVYEIADVLQVDVELLLGKEREGKPDAPRCLDQILVERIRATLERYDQMSSFLEKPPSSPPLSELRKAVNQAWLTYQHAKYGTLAQTLPRLLQDGQAADSAHANSTEAQAAANLLSQVYQIASSVLRKVGEHELSWLAADRSVAVSQRAGDQLLARTTGNRLLTGTAAVFARRHPLTVGRFRSVIDLSTISTRRTPPSDAFERDRLEPTVIRSRPLAHEILSDVLRRTRGTPPPPIAELAEQIGVGI
jgi:transcriptional regulator with XRE-family HTH domain